MKLSVFKNNEHIKDVDLSKEKLLDNNSSTEFYIGRLSTCHIVLDSQVISRKHAALIHSQNGWVVKSLSAFNKIWVNGKPQDSKEITKGDIITIDEFQLSVLGIDENSFNGKKEDYSETEIVVNPKLEAKTSEESKPEEETTVFQEEVIEEPVEEIVDVQTDSENENQSELSEESTIEETKDQGEENFNDEFDNNFDDNFELKSDGSGDDGFDNQNDDMEFNDFDSELDGVENSDDGLNDDLMSMDDSEKTQVVQNFLSFTLELNGQYSPYDRYQVDQSEVVIGKNQEKSDICLEDEEVSDVHAKLTRSSSSYILEDQNSLNGTFYNGERVNKVELKNGDTFKIGTTDFKVKLSSQLLQQESNRLMPVEENQIVEIEEILDEDSDLSGLDGENVELQTEPTKIKPFTKESWKTKEGKKKNIIYIIVILAVVSMMFDTEEKKPEKKQAKKKTNVKQEIASRKLTEQEKEYLEATYTLARTLVADEKFGEAERELSKIFKVVDEYKKSRDIYDYVTQRLREIEEAQRALEDKKAKELLRIKVAKLVEKAKEAVEKREEVRANNLFDEILQNDPENFEVQQLKLELKEWKRLEQKKALEKATREANRKRMVNAFKPGRNHYLKREWYEASIELDKFLKLKDIDEDLVKEASDMMIESQNELKKLVQPLLRKAKSLLEGQDLKGAYDIYVEAVKYEPTNQKALSEISRIKEILVGRARKLYREALVSESLSLFEDAKEKLQEVQQISPKDSDYYIKASMKLKEYVE